jgi:hypothetical protein
LMRTNSFQALGNFEGFWSLAIWFFSKEWEEWGFWGTYLFRHRMLYKCCWIGEIPWILIPSMRKSLVELRHAHAISFSTYICSGLWISFHAHCPIRLLCSARNKHKKSLSALILHWLWSPTNADVSIPSFLSLIPINVEVISLNATLPSDLRPQMTTTPGVGRFSPSYHKERPPKSPRRERWLHRNGGLCNWWGVSCFQKRPSAGRLRSGPGHQHASNGKPKR